VIWGEGSGIDGRLGTGAAPAPVPPRPAGLRLWRAGWVRPARAAVLAAALALSAGAALADEASNPARDGFGPLPGAPEVDPSTGVASVLFPIEVPPGRHGLQPALGLRYSSTSHGGNAGLRFQFEVGSIERTTRFGPPRFNDSDTFVLKLDGQEHDLVPVDGTGTQFRTAVESGFLVARLSPGPFGPGSTYWVARGRDGRFYRFGFTNDPAVGNVSQVDNFKWGLDRVEDTAGNVMEMRYWPAGKILFVTRIEYAAHPASGLPPTNRVGVCWERRGDTSTSTSGEVRAYRLASIRTAAGGMTARTYTFGYQSSGGSPIGDCSAPLAVPTEPTPVGNEPDPKAPTPGPGGPRRIESTFETTASTALPDDQLSPVNSLLMTIERGDGGSLTLPPVRYTYTEGGGQRAWSETMPDAPPLPFVANSDVDQDPGVRMVDLNRDGLPDMLQLKGQCSLGCSTVKSVYLNTGGRFVYDAAWTAGLTNLVNPADRSRSAWFVLKRGTSDTVDNGVRFLDINDDGFPDIVRIAKYFDSGIRKGVYLNTGSGFTTDVSSVWPLPNEPFVALEADPSRDVSEDLGVRIADVNADGRMDLLVSRGEWGGPLTRRVYLHDHGQYRLDNGYTLPDEAFVRHISHGRWIDMGVRIMDLNADGWPDLFVAANVNGVVRNVAYLYTRQPGVSSVTWAPQTGWQLEPAGAEAFVDVSSAGDGSSLDRGLRVASATAIIMARSWNGRPIEKKIWSARVNGGWAGGAIDYFPTLFIIKRTDKLPRDQGVRLADLDGDGGVDLVTSLQVGTKEWRRSLGWAASRLLASWSNGLGGLTTLNYAPAPHGGKAEGGARAALPFALPVVARKDVSDAMGHTYTTTYQYDGPYYHHAAREFRGFRTVRVIERGGERTTETLHHQQTALFTAPLRGAAERTVTRRGGDGAIFSRMTWTYDTTDLAPPLAHPLTRVETALFEWTATDPDSAVAVRRTATATTYDFDEATHPPDRILRRRTERLLGDADNPDDDRTVVEEFAAALEDTAIGGPARGRWFLDLPAHRFVAGSDGQVVSENWTFYDDRGLGEVGALGLPTLEARRGGPPGPAGARAPDDRDNPQVIRTYDRYGNLETETDPLGRRRAFAHGSTDPTFTFPVSETDPLGRVTTRIFDARTGQLTALVDPNGNEVHSLYDRFGRKLADYGPYDTADRPTVAYRYDTGVVPARIFRYAREISGQGERAGTDGCIESIGYFDGLGRPLETRTESTGGQTIITGAVTFDVAGRVATEAEPFAVPAALDYVAPGPDFLATRFDYDAAGRRIAVTDPAGGVSREEPFAWDTKVIDPGGHRRDLHLDAFGNVLRVDEFEGGPGDWRPASSATYAYDAAGRPIRIVDPSGAAAGLGYDTLGRRTALDDPHTGSWRYEHDLKGSLIVEIDPAGRRTTMTYDPLDRLIERADPDGRRDRWTYDEGGAAGLALGHLTSIVDPTGMQRFAYDRLGRVVEASRTLDGATYTIGTTYDAMARVTLLALPGGRTLTYHYDRGGNLDSLGPYAQNLTYDNRGALLAMTLGSGVVVERQYAEATGLPERLRVDRGGGLLLDLAFRHDPDGLVTAIEDDTVTGFPRLQTFAYDGRHRLAHAAGSDFDLSYAYDDAGNITAKEGRAFTYAIPARSQWLSGTSAGETFLYDNTGNVTVRRSAAADWTYAYDAAGRMIRITEAMSGLTVTNDYDASGRRVREVTARGADRSALLTPMPQIEVRDGALNVHIFAGDLRVAILEPSGRTLYPIADFLGSTRLVLDQTGAVVSRHEYRPYGAAAPGSDPAPVTHTYAGGEANPATGLLLMGHRFLDPSLGRFLQPDALVAAQLDPQALNRYAYARNNPVNMTDPEGRNPIVPILFAGAIVLLDRQTRADVGTSVALTAATIFLTGALGPGAAAGLHALAASQAALYASAVTAVILSTPLGQGMVQANVEVLRELGVAPRTATIAASVFTGMFLNSSLQRGFATAFAKNGEAVSGPPIGDHHDYAAYLAAQGMDPAYIGPGSGDVYGTPIQGGPNKQGIWKDIEHHYELRDASGSAAGVYGTRDLGLGFEHGAVGFFDKAQQLTQSHYGYLVGGISTQQFARELFGQGYSGTLFTLTGRASDFLIEFIYGPYGGGLAVGVHSGREAGQDPYGSSP
jgi:RHS repeat-associated protein